MRYGHFDDKNREYVITRPETPMPWINYLGCEAYFGIISNTAGGYSYYRDARLRRLTRYRYNNAPFDYGGRYLYLRDNDNAEFWSPSWQPTRTKLDQYECRHGMGYSTIGAIRKGIEARTTYFVPLGQTLEVWKCVVTNHRKTTAKLSLFSSIEFCLWDAQDDATNFQRNFSTGQVEVVDGVIYHKTEYRERRNHFAYFACSEKLAGFDTQRDVFLGKYTGWDKPGRRRARQVLQLRRPRLGAARLASCQTDAQARRDARGHFRSRLSRESRGSEVRSRRFADHQQALRQAGHQAIPQPEECRRRV